MVTGVKEKAQTRLLLNLWNLGGAKQEVKKSDLTKQVKLSKERVSDYQEFYEQLEDSGAINLSTKGRSVRVLLTDKGLEMLAEGIKSSEFQYSPRQRVRTQDFNALLNWIKQLDNREGANNVKIMPQENTIFSYEEFKSEVIAIYESLNQNYNFDNLVPIYRIRREVGDKIERSLFDKWLLEMQANDIFQLIGGEMPGVTPEQTKDSVVNKLGGIRYYAKILI